jgi:hypothetical protein
VDKLDIETADRADSGEHLGLHFGGQVPGRLSASGRIDREDEPAALILLVAPAPRTSPKARAGFLKISSGNEQRGCPCGEATIG